jgi:branched-chain amino acid transport system substrate-binding protein
VVIAPVSLMVDMSRRFQEKFNRVPDHNAFKGYIGVHMLKAAVQRVGSWDQAKVRACLHNNVFITAEEPGLLMDVYVNDKGNLDRPSFIVEVRARNRSWPDGGDAGRAVHHACLPLGPRQASGA